MRKIIIVQSLPEWISIIASKISKDIPLITPYVMYTDSFDHAIDLIPKDGELIVITSGMFHDIYSDQREIVTQKISDSEKNGNKLAQMVKEINQNAKIYLFSEYAPKEHEYLDGFILKSKFGDKNVSEIIKILKKEETIKLFKNAK